MKSHSPSTETQKTVPQSAEAGLCDPCWGKPGDPPKSATKWSPDSHISVNPNGFVLKGGHKTILIASCVSASALCPGQRTLNFLSEFEREQVYPKCRFSQLPRGLQYQHSSSVAVNPDHSRALYRPPHPAPQPLSGLSLCIFSASALVPHLHCTNFL